MLQSKKMLADITFFGQNAKRSDRSVPGGKGC
jgi:hypothetical protein